MRKHLQVILPLLILIGCEDEATEDKTPPIVSIASPLTNSIVSEITTINCISSDNEGVEKVELWLNGDSTGLIDQTEPYSFDWNTTLVEDGSYNLIARSYDVNNNTSDSETIVLIVDNTQSYPMSSALYPTIFENGLFIITWSQNNDNDFKSYTLYESESEDMSNQTVVYSAEVSADTSYTLTSMGGKIRYYQIVVSDILELKSSSNIEMAYGFTIFNQTFGGSGEDDGFSVQQTDDGGYIITGRTSSYGDGFFNVLLVKTDFQGQEEWTQNFGGSQYEYGNSVQQTTDGGYIILGDITSYGSGSWDFWLIKTNSQGIEEWNQTFGGSSSDYGRSVEQTTDGGYIIAGFTSSFGNGGSDVWLIKTGSDGNEEWNQTLGGNDSELGESVEQTTDGGYIITGTIFYENLGGVDVLLIKTDSDGNEEWSRTFGGNNNDYGYSVQQTTDGGYIISGSAGSFGIYGTDLWLIKADAQGIEEWNRTFDIGPGEAGYSVQQTQDGGYILTGWSSSENNWSNPDLCLIKTDSEGNKLWSQVFGGSEDDYGRSVKQTSEGGYVITGYTASYGNGDKNIWLIKTDSEGNTESFGY